MFEEQILVGDTQRSIRLDTHRGRPIDNVVEPDVGERERQVYALVRKKFGREWVSRKQACGIYNCYGMVFASRRTAILDDDQIPNILRDDGYRKIDEDSVVPGDLVFYKNGENGILLHAALVLRREPQVRKALYALSKWNSFAGEDEHHVRHHCWPGDEFEVKLEFWTDRPPP